MSREVFTWNEFTLMMCGTKGGKRLEIFSNENQANIQKKRGKIWQVKFDMGSVTRVVWRHSSGLEANFWTSLEWGKLVYKLYINWKLCYCSLNYLSLSFSLVPSPSLSLSLLFTLRNPILIYFLFSFLSLCFISSFISLLFLYQSFPFSLFLSIDFFFFSFAISAVFYLFLSYYSSFLIF